MESKLEKKTLNSPKNLFGKVENAIEKALSFPMGVIIYLYELDDYLKIRIKNDNNIKNGYENLIIEPPFPSLKSCIKS